MKTPYPHDALAVGKEVAKAGLQVAAFIALGLAVKTAPKVIETANEVLRCGEEEKD